MADPALSRALAAIAGPDHVLTGDDDRRFYSTDVFRAGCLPDAVVRPGTVEEVQAIVRHCHATRTPVSVRGGGASYTDGYTPPAAGGITLSMERLDRILAIDTENRTVTVEAGCTWAVLDAALRERGFRTPFFGPFSGLRASIGGALSQNAVSHGSGAHGSAAESLLTLEVVTGTGALLKTGSAGSAVASPFFRHYGPDLAGLFTGDCGALGIKCRASFRLLRRQTAAAYASFRFRTFEDLHAAMHAIAAERLDDTHFAIDREIAAGQVARAARLEAKAGILKSVLAEAGSLRHGAEALVRLARAGLSDEATIAPYAAHYVIEAASDAEAEARLDRLRALAHPHGEEMPAAIPTVTRAQPFPPLHAALGPGGERWVPVHGLFPHDRVAGFHRALQDYLRAQRETMERFSIRSGTMFLCVGPSAFLYEPTFVWPDARTAYHARALPAEFLERLPEHPPAPDAFEAVVRMKADVARLMDSHGAAHFQVGRFYDYAGGRDPAALALLRALKAALDPDNILSPGALGL